MEKVIEVNNLSFKYSGRLVLDNVSFFVEKGDFMGIIGSNGSGKSTLIKLILGILNPLNGEIVLLNEKIQSFSKWDKIGYVSQKATSFNGSFPATVEEVVGANLFSKVGLFKSPGKQHKELIYHALELVDMQDYGKRLIGNLSGGQQQRVFIARALVSSPEILFLDEPTSGIDAKSEEALYCLLAKLNKELGITILMVSHDIGAITGHANKLLCIGENRLFVHNSGDEISEEFVAEMYGYGVKMHIQKHDCINCKRKEII